MLFYIVLYFAVDALLDLVEPIVTADTVWMYQWEVYKAVYGCSRQQGTVTEHDTWHHCIAAYQFA